MDFDFEQLANEYKELKRFIIDGRYDFYTHESISCLTHYILLHYFKLNVEISSVNLCPRVPNRLSYLSFINEHILKYDNENGLLIDVGTGYCLIYLLLLAKLSKWGLIGTEINADSITKARQIIDQNSLTERIELVHKKPEDMFLPDLSKYLSITRIVTVCNPPFYSSFEELSEKETFKTRKKSELIAMTNELVTEGGEYEFIRNLILQSLFNTKIEWFTTLVGKNETIVKLTKMMRVHKISNYFISKLMEDKRNRTQRWIIGWSFLPKRIVIESFSPNQNIQPIPKIDSFEKLTNKLDQLQLKYHLLDDGISVTIHKEVWSRRYKRMGRSIEDSIGIKVLIYSTHINWTYGFNFDLFERFANFVRKEAAKLSR